MVKQTVDDWTTKWAPAILEYGYTLTGKKATMVLTAQKTYEVCNKHNIHKHVLTCIKLVIFLAVITE